MRKLIRKLPAPSQPANAVGPGKSRYRTFDVLELHSSGFGVNPKFAKNLDCGPSRLLIRRSITATDESDSAFFPGTSRRLRMQMSSWDFGNRLDPIPKNLVRAEGGG